MKLIEMNLVSSSKLNGPTKKYEKSPELSFLTENSDNKSICRVCLNGNDSKVNPMISPCNCSGSVKYIHLKCLHRWIQCKFDEAQNENCIKLLWKNLKCEICKGVIPRK
jgi:E3 ubiquitin-protein ligase DOA10